MFRDRQEAGQRLADELARFRLANPTVLALPRGGVPVAAGIARRLAAPLDLMIVRKVGSPANPELAVAAIVDGDPPDVVLNRDVIDALGLGEGRLKTLIARERPELERRRRAYLGDRPPSPVAGRAAILVDDGAATGATMKVAIQALRRRAPREIVVALPVAPPDTIAELGRLADRIVCLKRPEGFRALGACYRDFSQLSDEDVMRIMRAASVGPGGSSPRRGG